MAVNPPRALIAEAVNVVIHIAGRGRKRRIESIARVVGFDGVGYQLADALEAPFPELLPQSDVCRLITYGDPIGDRLDARPLLRLHTLRADLATTR